MICYDQEIHPKTNVEPPWNDTSVFLGIDEQIFPEPLRAHENSAKECMGLLTEFKEKMQQTELLSFHLIEVEVPVHSLVLDITDTKNAGTKMH